MAVAFLSAAGGTGTGTSSAGPHTIARGALSDGCVVFLFVSWVAAVTVTTAPAGFTKDGATRQDGTTGNLDIYWKYIAVASSEPAWTITFSAAARMASAMACYSGVDTTSPLDPSTFTFQNETASANTSRETGTATTTDAATWLLWGCFDRLTSASSVNHTDATGTERVDQYGGSGTNAMHMALYDSNGSVAAAGYSKTITGYNTAIAGGFIGGIKAAAGGITSAGVATGTGTAYAAVAAVGGSTVTEVAPTSDGSSDPTYRIAQHHLDATAAGRLLAVHGQHGDGVRLRWSDDAGVTWSTVTRGSVTDGRMLSGAGTGDRPASIVVAGTVAYVVWGLNSANGDVSFRRLSDLDNAAGPNTGATQTAVASIGRLPDIALETKTDGTKRVCLSWWEETSAGTAYNSRYGWITDLTVDNPTLTTGTIVSQTGTGRYGTLVQRDDGLGFVVRGASGNLRLYTRGRDDAVSGAWTEASTNPGVSLSTIPAAVYAGKWIAALNSNEAGGTEAFVAQSWAADGTGAATDLTMTGYLYPTLSTDGTTVYLVAVRIADDVLVSRFWTSGAGWSSTDVLEVGGWGGGHLSPNAARALTNGQLRYVFPAPGDSVDQRRVLYGVRQVIAAGTNAPAGTATGTAVAETPSVAVTVNAGQPTGVGLASDASVTTAVNAEAAGATGVAFAATASTVSAVSAPAEVATGSAAGFDATVALGAQAEAGTATAAVLDAAVSLSVAAGSPTGAGLAADATAVLSVNAEAPAGVGTALNATVSTVSATNAPAEVATATGAASDATVALTVTAEAPTAAGASLDAAARFGVAAGQPAGSGSAADAQAALTANAGAAAGTGTANDATVSTSSSVNAPAEAAAGTGTAADATVALGVNAETATGAGTALDATVSTSSATSANAEAASGNGAAFAATVAIGASAEAPAGAGSVPDAAAVLGANAATATGTAAALDVAAALGASPTAAQATGTAETAYIALVVAVEAALAQGTAYNVQGPSSGLDWIVHRPDTGDVAPPSTGPVTRPTTGITTRPGTGTITRPDTGDVERPSVYA